MIMLSFLRISHTSILSNTKILYRLRTASKYDFCSETWENIPGGDAQIQRVL